MFKEQNIKRLVGIDAFRYFAFIAVVVLHCVPWVEDYGVEINIFKNLARFAVPFFFIASGYFLGRSNPAFIAGTLKAFLRLAPIFIFWTLAYLFLFGDLTDLAEPHKLVKIFISGGSAYHMWFLPALGTSLVLLLAVKDMNARIVVAFASLLYLIGLALGPYSDVLDLSAYAFRTRNGPFFGFALVTLGFYLSQRDIRLTFRKGVMIASAGLLLQISEAIFISYMTHKSFTGYDFLLGTIIFGAGVFVMALNSNENALIRQASEIGFATLGMYCIHVFFIVVLMNILDVYVLWQLILIILLVVISSSIVSVFAGKIPYLQRVFK